MTKKPMSVGQAAKRAGVTRQAVWSWIRSGMLVARRDGHYHTVTEAQLRRCLRKREERDAQTRRNVIARASQTLETMK